MVYFQGSEGARILYFGHLFKFFSGDFRHLMSNYSSRPSRMADRWRAVPDTVPPTYASTKSISFKRRTVGKRIPLLQARPSISISNFTEEMREPIPFKNGIVHTVGYPTQKPIGTCQRYRSISAMLLSPFKSDLISSRNNGKLSLKWEYISPRSALKLFKRQKSGETWLFIAYSS